MAKKSLPQRGDSRKDIDQMNSTELRAYIGELMQKRGRITQLDTINAWGGCR